MIPPQAMMKDAISPHTPSPLSADADATVTGTDIVYLARPPATTRRMALAAQARRRHVSDAFRGARIGKDLGRPRHRGGRDPFTGEKLKPATVLSASAEHLPPRAAPNSIPAFVAPKTENLVSGGGLLPHPEDECPPVNEARCSNQLLEHLEHLHETNDLFGNVAKFQNPRQIRSTGDDRVCGFQ